MAKECNLIWVNHQSTCPMGVPFELFANFGLKKRKRNSLPASPERSGITKVAKIFSRISIPTVSK